MRRASSSQLNALASTHHFGCADLSPAAAFAADASLSNRPKQVAPEPDMRASVQPFDAASSEITSVITGWIFTATGSRSLRPALTAASHSAGSADAEGQATFAEAPGGGAKLSPGF